MAEFEKLQSEIKNIQQDFSGILKENTELKVFYEETLYVQKYEAENRAPIDDETLKRFRDGVFGRLDDLHSSKKRKLLLLGEKGREAEDLIYTIDMLVHEEIAKGEQSYHNTETDDVLRDVGVSQ